MYTFEWKEENNQIVPHVEDAQKIFSSRVYKRLTDTWRKGNNKASTVTFLKAI